jgi:beta-mannosidase
LMKEIIKPNTSEVVAVFQIHRMIGSAKKSRLVLVSRLKKGNNILAEQISYFKVPKELELSSPKIKTSLLQIPTGYRVELTANSLARNVYLACGDENARCSDNYFDLLPRAKKTITVSTAMNKEDFKRTLKTVSLVDSFR